MIISVTDDGWGACPAALSAAVQGGYARCRKQLTSLRGRLDVTAGAAGGTLVTARFPLPEAPVPQA